MRESDISKTFYTHRDYDSIYSDLTSLVPALTDEWTSLDEADPFNVILKLVSMLGDNLSYNTDKEALEHYLETVTQRKNCANILRLLGYKMRWYRAAQTKVALVSTDDTPLTITTYATSVCNDDISYIITNKVNEEEVIGEHRDFTIGGGQGFTSIFNAIQGELGYTNFYKDSIDGTGRLYLDNTRIDDTHIWITNDDDETIGQLVDDIRLLTDTDRLYYEFKIDEFDKPYIQLMSGWEAFTTLTSMLRVNYIVTDGKAGCVSDNVFTYTQAPSSNTVVIRNANNTYRSDDGIPGYNPETVEDARRNSAAYNFTINTLVTPEDFNKACKQIEDIVNCSAVDIESYNRENGTNSGMNLVNSNDCKRIIHPGDGFKPIDYTFGNNKLNPYIGLLYPVSKNTANNEYTTGRISEEHPAVYSYVGLEDGSIDYWNQENVILRGTNHGEGYFPYRLSNEMVDIIKDNIEQKKSVTTNLLFPTAKIYPYTFGGVVYLYKPLSPRQTLNVALDIENAIKEKYSIDVIKFGELPNVVDIIDICQNANPNIRVFTSVSTLNLVNYYWGNPDTNGFDSTSLALFTGLAWGADLTDSRWRIQGELHMFDNLFVFNKEAMTFTIKYNGIGATSSEDNNPITNIGASGLDIPEEYKRDLRYEKIVFGRTLQPGQKITITLDTLAQLNTLVYYLERGNGMWTDL